MIEKEKRSPQPISQRDSLINSSTDQLFSHTMASEDEAKISNGAGGERSPGVLAFPAPNSPFPDSQSLVVATPPKTHYPPSFWLAFLGLCCTGLVSALDGSIVAIALPSIISELHGGDEYVWVSNVYFLTRYRNSSELSTRKVAD